MTVVITDHARRRFRRRTGLTYRAMQRVVERAAVGPVVWIDGNAKQYRRWSRWLFVFDRAVLVTVLHADARWLMWEGANGVRSPA
jgi:hypothetical protein